MPERTIDTNLSAPTWAIEPPENADPRPVQMATMKSNQQCSTGELARKELFSYGGVHWHGKFNPPRWTGHYLCKNPHCRDPEVACDVNATTTLVAHCKTKKCMGARQFLEIIEQLKKGTTQTSIKDHFQKFSQRDKDICSWIEVIVAKNMPLSVVEDAFWRKKLHCGQTIVSIKTIRQIIACLTVVVQGKIATLLGDRWALILDGWSKRRKHYLALFAVQTDEKGVLQTPLLSMSPLKNPDQTDPFGYSKECTTFGAAEHAAHIKAELKNKFLKSTKNVVCLIADHASVNIALANAMGKPLVGCRAHRHGLEMNNLLKESKICFNVVQTSHMLMKKAMQQKVSVELYNANAARPVMWNKTRWVGHHDTSLQTIKMEADMQKVESLKPFLIMDDMEEDLFPASDNEDGKKNTEEGDASSLESDDEAEKKSAKRKIKKKKTKTFRKCTKDEQEAVLKLLNKQKIVSKSMQPHDLTLLSADEMILTGRKEIEDNIEEIDPDCEWIPVHMADDYTVRRVGRPSHLFEKAVKKLQSNEPLSEADKNHVKMLLKKKSAEDESDDEEPLTTAAAAAAAKGNSSSEDSDDVMMSPRSKRRKKLMTSLKSAGDKLAKKLMPKKKKTKEANPDYIDASFILGTSVVVERFFSECKHILTDHRASLTPFMFECLSLLKVNREL